MRRYNEANVYNWFQNKKARLTAKAKKEEAAAGAGAGAGWAGVGR